VAHDEERPLPAAALQAGDDVRAVRVESEDLRGNPFDVEHLLEILDRDVFVPGRVGRVEPQYGLVVAQDLGLNGGPVRLTPDTTGARRRRLSRQRRGETREAPSPKP
jgi:hypothetical protein